MKPEKKCFCKSLLSLNYYLYHCPGAYTSYVIIYLLTVFPNCPIKCPLNLLKPSELLLPNRENIFLTD